MRCHIIGILIGGVFATILSQYGMTLPAPPAWVLAWTAWIAAVVGFFVGGKALLEVAHAVKAAAERTSAAHPHNAGHESGA
jgi:type II secretory pathway component PulF